ncbi:hypothetical protein AMJ80_01470 [bacterium SM23_31]|nr:MAG: hypothetical protein AMJ80_01470 [bacterium SM23_31]
MKNYYLLILFLLLSATAAVFLSCHNDPLANPNLYFFQEEEQVAFSSEGYEHFHIQNLRGNVIIVNSDDDSIKIKLNKYSTSEFSEEVAKRNMIWIVAGLDSAIQDTAVYVIYWEALSFDINLRVDLEVQVPAGINFSSSITSAGHQDITVNIPGNNTGNIFIYNYNGNVRITLPQSASAAIIADAGTGRIILDTTFNPVIEEFELIYPGALFRGFLNDGTGYVKVSVDIGDIIFAGT